METTFITIHELTPEARIKFTSDSVIDILGYAPQELVNRSCWDFFHPDELPYARLKYESSVLHDKAAMLSYCRVRDRNGLYVCCEVVFTIVYDCMVGCTSIYRHGTRSQNLASHAPVIRRLFHTSPRDPRYHMLSLFSHKFQVPPEPERRAALFLNRYTKTLTIMFATDGLADDLGLSGEDLSHRSFYHCIQEECLPDAMRCLENAKKNDSVAYLRFWFRDPRQDGPPERRLGQDSNLSNMDLDANATSASGSESEDTEMGGVKLDQPAQRSPPDIREMTPKDDDMSKIKTEEDLPRDPRPDSVGGLHLSTESSGTSQAVSSESSVEPVDRAASHLAVPGDKSDSRASSGDSMDPQNTHEHIFGDAPVKSSSESSVSTSPSEYRNPRNRPIELEAVISCGSDGMVVCMRRARTPIPVSDLHASAGATQRRGVFAAPWATPPTMPPMAKSSTYATSYGPGPQTLEPDSSKMAPSGQAFMNTIRDMAVFAWALTGINGTLAAYSTGQPRGEAQPAQGLPIWQPNDASQHPGEPFGQPPPQLP